MGSTMFCFKTQTEFQSNIPYISWNLKTNFPRIATIPFSLFPRMSEKSSRRLGLNKSSSNESSSVDRSTLDVSSWSSESQSESNESSCKNETARLKHGIWTFCRKITSPGAQHCLLPHNLNHVGVLSGTPPTYRCPASKCRASHIETARTTNPVAGRKCLNVPWCSRQFVQRRTFNQNKLEC